MDRFEAMSVFVSVVEAGSLSAAGRALGMPLPTVSRKISELEARINVRLLQRSTRRLTLTDAGTAYFTACKRILEDVGDAERAASGEYRAPKGELVVTAPIEFGRLHVLPITTQFLQAYPDVDVTLLLADRVVDLLDEHVDLAVRIGELPDSRMIALRIGSVRRVVCASPGYLERRGVPQRPQDLAAHDCVTFSSLPSAASWDFAIGDRQLKVPVRSRLVVNTAQAAIEAAIAGIGLTRVLSYQISRAIDAGSLAVVLEKFEPTPMPIHLLRVGERLTPAKLRAFLDFAAPRLRGACQDIERRPVKR
jgi:DNA-binding transcriptional LysR family regulator